MTEQDKWQWFGNSGHLCVAKWCRFHLTTLVGPWLVSTVGEYVHPRHYGGSELEEARWIGENWPGEDVGLDRKYETMVFKCGDQTCECGCGLPIPDKWCEVAADGYNTPKDAREGHMKLCFEFAGRESDQ